MNKRLAKYYIFDSSAFTMKRASFFMEYFRKPRELGTFTQSSKFLVDSIVNEITGKNIVEIGAGTGPVTKGILKKLCTDGKLFSFEINPKLYRFLRRLEVDPRFRAINDSAENLENYVQDIDCIVSGLPLTSLKKITRKKTLEICRKYPLFIQYKYWDSKKLLENYFSDIKIKREIRNFPPAIIYICRNRGF